MALACPWDVGALLHVLLLRLVCYVSFAHCMHLGNCFETQIELHLSCCIDLEQLLWPGLHENLTKLQPA